MQELEAAVEALKAEHPAKAIATRTNPSVIGWWVGMVMQQTAGRYDPAYVNVAVRKVLGL